MGLSEWDAAGLGHAVGLLVLVISVCYIRLLASCLVGVLLLQAER